ncbi:hypothetical protein [Escherichia coli]|uniref:hypothetical protein n=1 Tax=Escherichia coli TaxID=562 RepID=UPI0012B12F92|nr:hypothetical protein [Escherichia coli]EFC5129662.1 hypothetical protein [Escherichia coli]EJL9712727.1 hypothetical protein [Escherichia coli]MSG97093.1 hypothetical protein [Escherichia coli]MSH35065.1 hypothetical protein [Escherichia coli]MSI38689.1 hypothetical protein [Escherichia coli]
MSDQNQKQNTNQPSQQSTTQPTPGDKPRTDFSLDRRFVGNSADKIRKKDSPQ